MVVDRLIWFGCQTDCTFTSYLVTYLALIDINYFILIGTVAIRGCPYTNHLVRLTVSYLNSKVSRQRVSVFARLKII